VVADAFYAALVAFAGTTLLTPPVARLAVRVGAVDRRPERGLARTATPLLGGLAILAGVLAAGALFLPLDSGPWPAVLAAALLIAAVGAIDDLRDLRPAPKLAGQVVAAVVLVEAGVVVQDFTLPLIGRAELGDLGGPLTVLGLVAVMNVVNFSDGVDGLAAGVCAISAAAFAVIAFDLGRDAAGILAAIACGAALGFLVHNFHPAAVFMGDCGSLLLGLLLGVVLVEGSVKTNALVALIVPLVVLAVPFLDTTFVLLKRMKYRRAPWGADANHFHHRFARIGFSQRRTVLYLYAWTLMMALLALGVRFIPYSESDGRLVLGWSLVMGVCFAVAFAASVYLVYVLEILKLKRLRSRFAEPGTAEHEIVAQVQQDLETGEFSVVQRG
jgi:UDP-GlcNAc:undecaprenyl-phosphate/decaprenyl-phosphate GlcNAc-1-phosphate transferase